MLPRYVLKRLFSNLYLQMTFILQARIKICLQVALGEVTINASQWTLANIERDPALS